jgi:hypothetical protein
MPEGRVQDNRSEEVRGTGLLNDRQRSHKRWQGRERSGILDIHAKLGFNNGAKAAAAVIVRRMITGRSFGVLTLVTRER